MKYLHQVPCGGLDLLPELFRCLMELQFLPPLFPELWCRQREHRQRGGARSSRQIHPIPGWGTLLKHCWNFKGLLKDPSAGTWVKVFISLDCKCSFEPQAVPSSRTWRRHMSNTLHLGSEVAREGQSRTLAGVEVTIPAVEHRQPCGSYSGSSPSLLQHTWTRFRSEVHTAVQKMRENFSLKTEIAVSTTISKPLTAQEGAQPARLGN
ncbi:uncharacterized protein LOC111935860 isoform X2 [Cyanistes caeruleus]|uniref:uncharacterized protein LOC111935860 isoform X2 n=1 Tax=Cyanistes caeruleus TaxID=156563 RepID=UPI000CDB4BB1|nr:uncharacterized protein LOC111935860 isoform X2 [Cyanistes caeruleus]